MNFKRKVMKEFTITAVTIVTLIVGVVLFGCSNDHEMTSQNAPAVLSVASISPSDGSTGVSTSTSIGIMFTGPVDTLSVMNNLHLAGGQPMHEWYDSLMHYGGFGMMNMSMQDHMMHWMDSIHVDGEFHWNDRMDSCGFVPDAQLMQGTEYLCLLNESGMQGGHGGMMGGSSHGNGGYYMSEFTTGP